MSSAICKNLQILSVWIDIKVRGRISRTHGTHYGNTFVWCFLEHCASIVRFFSVCIITEMVFYLRNYWWIQPFVLLIDQKELSIIKKPFCKMLFNMQLIKSNCCFSVMWNLTVYRYYKLLVSALCVWFCKALRLIIKSAHAGFISHDVYNTKVIKVDFILISTEFLLAFNIMFHCFKEKKAHKDVHLSMKIFTQWWFSTKFSKYFCFSNSFSENSDSK